MQPLMREPSAHACLMNALAVSEFLATFGVLCEANRLSLQELQQAVSSLSHTSALAQLYTSLLRCVLLEKASQRYCRVYGTIFHLVNCCDMHSWYISVDAQSRALQLAPHVSDHYKPQLPV